MKSVVKSYEKKEKPRQIWVHPEFYNKIKGESGFHGMKLYEYTKKLSGVTSLREEFEKNRNEKKDKSGFSFRLS